MRSNTSWKAVLCAGVGVKLDETYKKKKTLQQCATSATLHLSNCVYEPGLASRWPQRER